MKSIPNLPLVILTIIISLSILGIQNFITSSNISEETTHESSQLSYRIRSVSIVSDNTTLANIVAKKLLVYNISIDVYPLQVLNKAFENDYIMFLPDAVEKISGNKNLVKRIILSGKTLIFIGEDPLSKIFRDFSPDELPLTIIPIKEMSEGCVKNNLSKCAVVGETGGQKLSALAIKVKILPNSTRHFVTYIGFGSGFADRYEEILFYVAKNSRDDYLVTRESIHMNATKNTYGIIPIVIAQSFCSQSPYPWSLIG